MILLSSVSRHSEISKVILVFGVGLIGRHIVDALMLTGKLRSQFLPCNWSEAISRKADIEVIFDSVSNLLTDRDFGETRIDIVFSAGKAGFEGTDTEFQSELIVLRSLIQFSLKIKKCTQIKKAYFHLLSSGGGLFEGQRFVSNCSSPCPLRAYGRLKLEQERMVREELSAQYRIIVYRPSSVYGPAIANNRLGLISALIQCAINGNIAEIYGNPDTLRDFVLASDIAKFIRTKSFSEEPLEATYILASGKPSSMFEVVGFVERTISQKFLLKYHFVTKNAMDNSYCPSSLPDGWCPTSLREGIIQTYAKTVHYYTNSAPGRAS